MRSHHSQSQIRRRTRWALFPAILTLAFVLAGCTQEQLNGFLPADPDTTNHTGRIIGLWVTSWTVLLGVGILTWALILWSAIVYRRRKGQTGFPVQLRYNMPIEFFYTVVPFILIIGFFAFTARDQAAIEAPFEGEPDVHIEAIGKRWSWDFNYLSDDVHFAGEDLITDADGRYNPAQMPVLYLPVGEKIQIDLESRDVAHSFWIVEFLYKKDMLPGHSNQMYLIPEKEGVYRGKCAELCGEYHADMLFEVRVVPRAEYDAQMNQLRTSGHVGRRGIELNVNQNLPGNGAQNQG